MRIKSIRRLQYVDAGECASWLAAPGTGVAIPDDAMLSDINIEPFASMREEAAPDNGTDVCETVIKARGGWSGKPNNHTPRHRSRSHILTTRQATMPRC